MSASSTQQIPDNKEPARGVKHLKPPLKPKPIVPPRPKEISGSSSNSEIKNALLSPTCGPSSPTFEIPSAYKITQLTGPQPYGTRRTSLKRWSSSSGEEVNRDSNVLSPVENRASDFSTKVVTQPLSASLKPLRTGSVWKGSSPFMLTTRGWGEQKFNQGKDPHESESASQKYSSSLASKDTDLKKRETIILEENPVSNSNSNVRFTSGLEDRGVAANVQELIPSPTEMPSSFSEDVKMVSSKLGPSGILKTLEKTANSHESSFLERKQLPISPQSDLHFGVCKQSSQTEKAIRAQSFGNDEQIPYSCKTKVSTTSDAGSDAGSTLGQIQFSSEIGVNQGLEKREKNTEHQQVTHVASDQPPQTKDATCEQYPQYIDSAYEQNSQNHGIATQQHPKVKCVDPTAKKIEHLSPQTKHLQNPPVQYSVPRANELVSENLGTSDNALSESVEPETQERYRHFEHACDGKTEMRTWIKEEQDALSGNLQTSQRLIPDAQQETEQENQGKPEGKEKPKNSAGTQVTDYTVTGHHEIYKAINDEDNASTGPRDHSLTRGECYAYDDNDGSSSDNEEIKPVDRTEINSLSHTVSSFGYLADGNQHINTKILDDNVDEEADAKIQDYVPHKAKEVTLKQIESPPEYSSACGVDTLFTHDPETPSIRLYDPGTVVQSVITEHAGLQVQENNNLLSREFHPTSAESKELQHKHTETEVLHVKHTESKEPQEELSESFESNRSKSRFTDSEESQLKYPKKDVFYWSDSQDPTDKVNESVELSDRNNQTDGLKYFSAQSPMVQDIDIHLKRLEHTSEEQQPTHSQLEEPFHRYTQSEEMVHTQTEHSRYAQSEEPHHRYTQSETPIHRYIQSEHPDKQYVPSEESIHRTEELESSYVESEEPLHKNVLSEEPLHRSEQQEESVNQIVLSDEPIHRSEELESRYEESEEPQFTYRQSEAPINRYIQSEEPVKQYVLSDEPIQRSEELESRYEESEEPQHRYTQSEAPINRYIQSEEPVKQYILPDEPIHRSEELESSYEESEEPHHKYVQSEEPLHRSEHQEESVNQYVLSDEPIHRSEELEGSYVKSEEPLHKYVQSEEPLQRCEQPEESVHQYVQSEKQHHRSEEPEISYEQSEESLHSYVKSEEPDYQHAQSEEAIFRYTQSENLEYKDKSLVDSQWRPLYSEEHIQAKEPQQKTTMFEEKEHRLTESPEQGYMHMRSEEMASGPNISVAQNHVAIHSAEAEHIHKYLEHQHRDSYSEDLNYKDTSTDVSDHKEKLSEEQSHGHTQSVEPQILYTHPEESQHVDVLPDHQKHTDTRLEDIIERHTESDGSQSQKSQDAQADEQNEKHAYIKENINGHTEFEELQDSDITLDYSKIPLNKVDTIQAQSPEEKISQPDDSPSENFDFLEGTAVLDSSFLRCRASLGKKRCHRTPPPGTCASEEEGTEYWMFRDSTEPKSCPERDSDDGEKQPTSSDCTPDNSPSPGKSHTKKAGLFSGIISPSILKGRLKARNKPSEDEAAKPDSEDPKSPGKDKTESPSHSLNWLQALKKKKKKQPK